nr:LLM class flavin-dependent oxidoreductase [Anoxybacillus caldiproteolyticus]
MGIASIISNITLSSLHVAKAAAFVDKLSGERLILGVVTGDRPIEFPAFSVDSEKCSALFQTAVLVMKKALEENFLVIQSSPVHISNGALLPKPILLDILVLITGRSSQSVDRFLKTVIVGYIIHII